MTSLDLQSLRQAHQQQEKVSADYLTQIRFLDRIDGWLQSLIDCHAFAVDCCRTKRTDYMEAYAIVSSAAFSNAESTRLLLLRGFYGNALADIRALASAADLVADLSLTEDSPSKWLRSRFIAPDDNSREARSLRSYFKDSEIRKRIEQHQETPLSAALYGVASQAVHASPWGTQFFAAESLNKPGEFYVQYSPQFHPIRAVGLASMLESSLPHLCGYFVEACESVYKGKNHIYDDLCTRHLARLAQYKSDAPKRRKLFDIIRQAQDRISAGEDMDEVFSDLRSRLRSPREEDCTNGDANGP